MPRLAANISLLFTEVPFLDRFAAAAACGFKGVEILFPYDHPPEVIADKASMAGVKVVLFNTPPGDYAAGERGFGALPGREADFRQGLDEARRYLDWIETRQLHVLAGRIARDAAGAEDTYLRNLEYAGDLMAKDGVTVLIEPINLEGYFVKRPSDALQLLRRLGHANVKLQYDMFHAQNQEGALIDFTETNADIIAHIQIAGVPGRHEPDQRGEVNWRGVFDLLDSHGFSGWVGAEYNPRNGTIPGLGWAQEWGIRAPK
ncbi:MAG: TIM barrel protein [Alphaproteobacteria bacterium]|nr:TIM barrel protein [Alphaproteobacteria bacterium]